MNVGPSRAVLAPLSCRRLDGNFLFHTGEALQSRGVYFISNNCERYRLDICTLLSDNLAVPVVSLVLSFAAVDTTVSSMVDV